MQIVRIYTGSDHQTHFQDMDVATFEPMVTDPGPGPIRMNHGAGNTTMDFHNAPCRQYVVLLAGQMEIETGLGEKRTLRAGDVLVAEDLTGTGHITRSSGERVTLSVPLA